MAHYVIHRACGGRFQVPKGLAVDYSQLAMKEEVKSAGIRKPEVCFFVIYYCAPRGTEPHVALFVCGYIAWL